MKKLSVRFHEWLTIIRVSQVILECMLENFLISSQLLDELILHS